MKKNNHEWVGCECCGNVQDASTEGFTCEFCGNKTEIQEEKKLLNNQIYANKRTKN